MKGGKSMTSKQRAYLKSLASNITAIFQIGKSGESANLINQLDSALEARELIKITVLENSPNSVNNLGYTLSQKTNSILVQTIGNKIVLYRPKKENPKIILPN